MSDAAGSDRRAVALQAYGADLGRWPDAGVAAAARAALLAEPDFRREWEEARSLDGLLADHRAQLDREIVASGAMARLRAATPAATPRPVRWRQLAAAIVVAAVLGGAADAFLLPGSSQADSDTTIAVDTLVYGPDQIGL